MKASIGTLTKYSERLRLAYLDALRLTETKLELSEILKGVCGRRKTHPKANQVNRKELAILPADKGATPVFLSCVNPRLMICQNTYG